MALQLTELQDTTQGTSLLSGETVRRDRQLDREDRQVARGQTLAMAPETSSGFHAGIPVFVWTSTIGREGKRGREQIPPLFQ